MENNNTNTFREIREALSLSPLSETPRRVGDTILPVIDVNPRKTSSSKVIFNYISTTLENGTTVYTVPTGYRLFITGATLSASADVTANQNTIFGTLVSKDGSLNFIGLKKMSSTVFQESIFQNFSFPIRLESGDVIKVSNNFSVGASGLFFSVFGYLEEVRTA